MIALGLGVMLRGLRFDDPHITYRFAENLARGVGFAFNPGAATHALITTAPLYALLLSIPGALGIDIPAASTVIGVASLAVAAWALFMLGRQRGQAKPGFSAGLIFLIFPLTWLTLGFETPLFMAVALLAFVAVGAPALGARWLALAGALCGLALGLRGDAVIVLGLCLAAAFSQRFSMRGADNRALAALRASLALLAVALLAYAPVALFLTLQFGSPIPTTLATKSAQAAAGLTGFYPGTTYAEGALLLLQAYLAQSPLFLVIPVAAGLGAYRTIQLAIASARKYGWGWVERTPFVLPVAWAVLHFAGYALIGVAPYAWYYAPIVPGLACLIALGADWVASLFQRRGVADQVILTALVLPLMVSNLNIARVLRGATPPPPSEVASKALPETKVDVYERAGRWLRQNTPADATVGVTELGVMSYYAGRNVTDFLGLTDPARLGAIRRGDFVGGLLRSQPDYLALTGVNAIYDANPQAEDWFRAIYSPVAALDDERFWGSPMTIWRRATAPVTPTVIVDEAAHDLGDGWQVTGVAVSTREVVTATPLVVGVRLKAGEARGERELRVQPIAVQRGDGLPVRSRVIHTDQFRPGEEAWVDFPILPYPDARRGAYDISVRWLDGGPEVIAGRVKVPLEASAGDGQNAYANVIGLSGEIGVSALEQSLQACVGSTLTLTPTWRGGDPTGLDYSAFVQLRDATGAVVAQHEGQPRNGSYPASVWSPGERVPDPHTIALPAALAPGTYDVVAGLVDPATGARLPVAPSPQRASDDAVIIGTVLVATCE